MMRRWWWVVPLALLIVQLALVPPFGEFPLNDDWVASLVIKRTFERGAFSYVPLLSSYHLVPILVGLALTAAFGFSFLLLRLVGLVAGAACVVLLYRWLRSSGFRQEVGWLAAALLWFNPVFFNLSYTFMSDVPALLLLFGSLAAYHRGFRPPPPEATGVSPWRKAERVPFRSSAGAKEGKLRMGFAPRLRRGIWRCHGRQPVELHHGSWRWLSAGSIFAVAGFFTRPFVLLATLAAGLYHLAVQPRDWRGRLLGFGLPLVAAGALAWWLASFGVAPGGVGETLAVAEPWSNLQHRLGVAWAHLLELSLFVFPVSAALLFANRRWLKQPSFWVCALVLATAAAVGARWDAVFPDVGNIVTRFGLGPGAGEVLQGTAPTFGPAWGYLLLHYLLAVSLAPLFVAIREVWQQRQFPAHGGFVWLFTGSYSLLILLLPSFDRYLLLLLPTLLLLTAVVLEHLPWSRVAAVTLTVALAAYSMLGTRHYLEWNRSRWALAERLQQQGVAVEQIEAGLEWNGWNIYARHDGRPIGPLTPTWAPWYIRDVTPGHQMDYIVAFSPLGGYEVVATFPVRGAIFGAKTLYANHVVPGSLR